ncbi:MAG TPA: DUF427 domain-containing protein [Caulobacteraceae bacterium]
MKTPGPDHPITLAPCRRRVRAVFQRHVIAETDDALILREAGDPPVYYLPMDDVEMSFLARTDHATTCPYKGHASYWSIYMDGRLAEDAVWAYEDPHPAVAALRGRIAFDPKAVEVYEVDEPEMQRVPAPDGDTLLP